MRSCLDAVADAATRLRLELATLGDTIVDPDGLGGVHAKGERVETPDASGAGPEASNSLETLPLFEDYSEQPDSAEHKPHQLGDVPWHEDQ